MIWSKEFWKDTLERTIGTMAEVALPLIPIQSSIVGFDWGHFFGIVLGSGVCCVLKCIIFATKSNSDSKKD